MNEGLDSLGIAPEGVEARKLASTSLLFIGKAKLNSNVTSLSESEKLSDQKAESTYRADFGAVST